MSLQEDMISKTKKGNKTFWKIIGRFMEKSNKDTMIRPLKILMVITRLRILKKFQH